MSRRQTLVQLNDALLARLDQRAAQLGCSRSHAIRTAVEGWLEADPEGATERAILEGYARAPATAGEDTWAELSTIESIAEEPW